MIDVFSRDILARTIYGEARGEWARLDGGLAALMAVGNVVLNRLRLQSWYGATVEEVCLKPCQFSCWNKADPNRAALEKVTATDATFATCLRVAEALLEGRWPDVTKGATHYYSTLLATPPVWAALLTARIKIGQHLFFKA
ncbi:hypothetical protein AGMMS49949_00660 [Alphaproteobacteria bacterium]|nr:hypothetical protein AGMMS49949_00660 [Alphaproteobacteria bacterium]GHS98260.1 hypothetical protein AGMMS50296_5830 [Alphaproteobacteria bacterium]